MSHRQQGGNEECLVTLDRSIRSKPLYSLPPAMILHLGWCNLIHFVDKSARSKSGKWDTFFGGAPRPGHRNRRPACPQLVGGTTTELFATLLHPEIRASKQLSSNSLRGIHVIFMKSSSRIHSSHLELVLRTPGVGILKAISSTLVV